LSKRGYLVLVLTVPPNVLRLPVVGILEHSTVYTHKCLLNVLMFISKAKEKLRSAKQAINWLCDDHVCANYW